MKKVLVVQNTKAEGPANLGRLLESDGFELNTVLAKKEKLPHDDFSLALVLGAPESVNDDLGYLREEQRIILELVQKNTPVLGICLGSQLIAKAFGGRVYRAQKKEIGFYDNVQHLGSRFLEGIKNPFSVFHWHGDTFDLPKEARLLARSQNYNQAFEIKTAVALQFHLEVDRESVNLWLDKTKEDLSDFDVPKIRKDLDAKLPVIENNLKIFYQNFKSAFGL